MYLNTIVARSHAPTLLVTIRSQEPGRYLCVYHEPLATNVRTSQLDAWCLNVQAWHATSGSGPRG